MLFPKFVPDFYFDDIYCITPAFLKENGIGALIMDIDNTLVTYDDADPTERVLAWFDVMTTEGIKLSFVSNNHKERVERFNSKLGYFATYDSSKPSRKALRRAIEAMGSTTIDTVMIGDQVFTDVYAGKRLGLRTILVKPIKDKTTLFVRTKRFLERPILWLYRRHKAKKQKNAEMQTDKGAETAE